MALQYLLELKDGCSTSTWLAAALASAIRPTLASRRQEALGHAEAWIGQDGSPGGGCSLLVVPQYEIADGYGLVTPKG